VSQPWFPGKLAASPVPVATAEGRLLHPPLCTSPSLLVATVFHKTRVEKWKGSLHLTTRTGVRYPTNTCSLNSSSCSWPSRCSSGSWPGPREELESPSATWLSQPTRSGRSRRATTPATPARGSGNCKSGITCRGRRSSLASDSRCLSGPPRRARAGAKGNSGLRRFLKTAGALGELGRRNPKLPGKLAASTRLCVPHRRAGSPLALLPHFPNPQVVGGASKGSSASLQASRSGSR
jgi:hypothetical protein